MYYGKNVNLYINTSNIISGNTYYIDIIYNNNILFSSGYGETLIITESAESGEHSGDSGGSVDLSETNNLIRTNKR